MTAKNFGSMLNRIRAWPGDGAARAEPKTTRPATQAMTDGMRWRGSWEFVRDFGRSSALRVWSFRDVGEGSVTVEFRFWSSPTSFCAFVVRPSRDISGFCCAPGMGEKRPRRESFVCSFSLFPAYKPPAFLLGTYLIPHLVLQLQKRNVMH